MQKTKNPSVVTPCRIDDQTLSCNFPYTITWYLPRWGQLKLFKFIPDKIMFPSKLVTLRATVNSAVVKFVHTNFIRS